MTKVDTPTHVYHDDHTQAPADRIFVFGSNLAGFHGAGAALAALNYYNCRMGVAEGRSGRSYAIPTKDKRIVTLPMEDIIESIARFTLYTQMNPDLKFFVTRVGCGLAGLKDKDVAPFFFEAINCSFAKEWKPYIQDMFK